MARDTERELQKRPREWDKKKKKEQIMKQLSPVVILGGGGPAVPSHPSLSSSLLPESVCVSVILIETKFLFRNKN